MRITDQQGGRGTTMNANRRAAATGAGLSLLLALGVGVPGCQDSEGSDDKANGGAAGDNRLDHAGGATTGGEAADAGHSGAAEGGSGGDGGGGAPGIGGGNDSAGAGGELGVGRSYAATDCSGREVDLDPEWVKYCVVLSSCQAMDPGWCLMSPKTGYDVSVNGWLPGKPYDFGEPGHDRFELESCEKHLSTCDDLLACSGSRALQHDCDATTTAHCAGERAINCGSKPGFDAGVRDCERLTGRKGACQVVGAGSDARALCVVKSTCDAPGTQTCDGDQVVDCDATGVGAGEDCAQFGLKCRVAGTRAFCAPPLPTATCDNKGSLFCDGSAAAYCNPDGFVFKGPDCGTSGDLVCSGGGADNTGDNWWDCVPRGCSITAWAGEGSECRGDDYVSKMGFWTLRIRCADYGLTCKNGGCAPPG